MGVLFSTVVPDMFGTVQCPHLSTSLAESLASSVGDLDRIRIRFFSGLLVSDPDPLIRGTDPDPDQDLSLFS
jgi:hypothetical protein